MSESALTEPISGAALEAPSDSGLVNPVARLLAGAPASIEGSEGPYYILKDGRKILDCEGGRGAFSLGHRPPRVVEALREAAKSWDIGNHHLMSEPKGLLARRLAGLTPGSLNRCVFNVTASEAVDVAVKLARGATGNPTVLCADDAYHGSTGYSLAASHKAFGLAVHANIPGFLHVSFADERLFVETFKRRAKELAAVIVEPVAVEAGALPRAPGFLGRLRRLCDYHQVLLIVDEAVTGLGRSGKLFAVDLDSVVPDILVVGNALGAGLYPIHATCHGENLDHFYRANPFIHVSTYGGSELGCYCAMAALDQLSKRSFIAMAGRHATLLASAFAGLLEKHRRFLTEVTNFGLLFGLHFTSPSLAEEGQASLFKNGLLCRRAALNDKALLLIPPLSITDVHRREIIGSLEAALQEMEDREPV